MSYPSSRICSGCKKVFVRSECKIDIGKFWNLSKGLTWACSNKCAESAKNNWISSNGKDLEAYKDTLKLVKHLYL